MRTLAAYHPPLAVLVVGAIAGALLPSEAYLYVFTLVLLWAAVGGSWNIISGYGGQMAFGHAVFFGIGAFTSTILMSQFHLTPLVGVWAGIFLAVLAALLIGWPTFKLRGTYFSLATLAYPLMFIPVLSYLGYQEVSVPFIREGGEWFLQFSETGSFALVALGLLVLTMVITLGIERSRLGASLLAVRDDESAAQAAGINTIRVKLTAFAISAAIAAAAGTLYASILLVVTPHSVFGLGVTVKSLMVCLVGGLATVWGPLIGSAILIPLGHILLSQYGAKFPGIDNFVLGLFLMAVIVFAPEGLYWLVRDRFARRKAQAPRERAEESRRAAFPAESREAPGIHVGDKIMMHAEKLSKSFLGVSAVSEVTFELREREILGVIGPNGAGKTTLMNLLNGFVPPDTGRVMFLGTDCTGDGPWKMCRRGIGRTFQVPRALRRRTVLQNVEIGAYHRVHNVQGAMAAALGVLERIGLAARRDALVSELSTAELRKLELARALAGAPGLLLLDEPLAGLVAGDIREFSRLVKDLRREGLTIIIIEHTMAAMVELADRFLVLNNGETIAEGEPHVVVRDPVVIEAYLGRGWKAHAVQ